MPSATSPSPRWHVVRVPQQGPPRDLLYRFTYTIISAYDSAGRPPDFHVYRSFGPNSLYAYMSPRATELTAGALADEGFTLTPLGPNFDADFLAERGLDEMLPTG
jgi:hypothetical protein